MKDAKLLSFVESRDGEALIKRSLSLQNAMVDQQKVTAFAGLCNGLFMGFGKHCALIRLGACVCQ